MRNFLLIFDTSDKNCKIKWTRRISLLNLTQYHSPIDNSALLTVIRILIILLPHKLVNKSWYFTFISNFTENNTSKKLQILKSVLHYVSFAKRKPHKNHIIVNHEIIAKMNYPL